MKKVLTFFLFSFLIAHLGASVELPEKLTAHSRIFEVQSVLQKFPEEVTQYTAGAVEYSTIETLVRQFLVMEKDRLRSSNSWFEKAPKSLVQKQPLATFIPFVEKRTFAPGTEIAFWGDLHGSVHSLVRCLNTLKERGYIDDEFRIIRPHFNMMFLGDFVDRGMYGIEVIYILMRLKLANPEHVFCIRGNHEDKNLNVHFGFHDELLTKFPDLTQKQINELYHIYDMFPLAFYCGTSAGLETNYVQCCHGGLEVGYNACNFLQSPQEFHWVRQIQRNSNISMLPVHMKQHIIKTFPGMELLDFTPIAPTSPSTIGFMWSDFEIDHPTEKIARYNSGRGWVYGQSLTEHLLAQASSQFVKLRGVFRAHQHNGIMLHYLKKDKGITPLWDNMVFTFLSAPAANLGFPCDSFGIVTLNGPYSQWTLEHIVKAAY
ncbi:hypothetical protein A3F06_01125 [candidate division TM6 bacterium RIFCSPHIGHO2_12_FULL_36_22]|nr:MAG: hypothetical protein A3F06_01125 [candidate division TM6 bacterium RIFCSPHIGHO2_12_FULL_36_22]